MLGEVPFPLEVLQHLEHLGPPSAWGKPIDDLGPRRPAGEIGRDRDVELPLAQDVPRRSYEDHPVSRHGFGVVMGFQVRSDRSWEEASRLGGSWISRRCGGPGRLGCHWLKHYRTSENIRCGSPRRGRSRPRPASQARAPAAERQA